MTTRRQKATYRMAERTLFGYNTNTIELGSLIPVYSTGDESKKKKKSASQLRKSELVRCGCGILAINLILKYQDIYLQLFMVGQKGKMWRRDIKGSSMVGLIRYGHV